MSYDEFVKISNQIMEFLREKEYEYRAKLFEEKEIPMRRGDGMETESQQFGIKQDDIAEYVVEQQAELI